MDMLVKLYDLPDSRGSFERLRQRGIHIRRALTAEKHKVAAWVRENFAEGWASETEIAFGRQPISCFIAVKAGKIAGFACHDVTCRNFFGPTGVEPESRKNGVGRLLFFLREAQQANRVPALHRRFMQTRDLETAWSKAAEVTRCARRATVAAFRARGNGA